MTLLWFVPHWRDSLGSLIILGRIRALMTLLKSPPSLSLFISNPNMVVALCPCGLILSEETH